MTSTQITELKKATALLEQAAQIMDKLFAERVWVASCWATEIREIVSCDNGEAGIAPVIAKYEEFASRRAYVEKVEAMIQKRKSLESSKS